MKLRILVIMASLSLFSCAKEAAIVLEDNSEGILEHNLKATPYDSLIKLQNNFFASNSGITIYNDLKTESAEFSFLRYNTALAPSQKLKKIKQMFGFSSASQLSKIFNFSSFVKDSSYLYFIIYNTKNTETVNSKFSAYSRIFLLNNNKYLAIPFYAFLKVNSGSNGALSEGTDPYPDARGGDSSDFPDGANQQVAPDTVWTFTNSNWVPLQ